MIFVIHWKDLQNWYLSIHTDLIFTFSKYPLQSFKYNYGERLPLFENHWLRQTE